MTMLPSASVILTYHRVAVGRDPFMQCVRPERFAEQMKRLAALAEVVPLSEITSRGRGLRVAITFDDGYADNLNTAAPVLREVGLPATFSIVARILDDAEEFWWDRLEHLLLDTDDGPQTLVVEAGGRTLRVDIRTVEGRSRALTALNRRLRELHPAEIAATMAAVTAQLGGFQPGPCEAHRLLTRNEVGQLADEPSFEVACHGMTHAMLSAVSGGDEHREVHEAKDALEAATGKPVGTFAYPYGTRSSFNAQTIDALRSTGVRRAVVNTPGLMGRFADRFRLPRFMVYDWTADELESEIKRWVAA